jgi:hypothetical protein
VSAKALQTFRAFLADELQTGDPPERIELVMAQAKGGANVVRTLNVVDPLRFSVESELADEAAAFARIAQLDAEGWAGVSRYFLRSYREGVLSTRSPVVRLAAVEDPSEPPEGGEPPTLQGITTALMRHNENLARALTQSNQALSAYSTETIARLTQANIEHERSKIALWEAAEEVASQRHTRELEQRREDRRDRAAEGILRGVTPLITAAGGRMLMGKKVDPKVAAEPHLQALARFAQNLSDDKVAAMMGILSPEEAATLATILATVQEAAGTETDKEATSGNEAHPAAAE